MTKRESLGYNRAIRDVACLLIDAKNIVNTDEIVRYIIDELYLSPRNGPQFKQKTRTQLSLDLAFDGGRPEVISRIDNCVAGR